MAKGAQVTVSAATPLFDADPSGGFALVVNRGSGSVFLGDASVTTSNGFELKTTDPITVVTYGPGEILYAAATAPQRVDVITTFVGP